MAGHFSRTSSSACDLELRHRWIAGVDPRAEDAAASAPGFVTAQVLGGCLAVLAIRALYPHVSAAEAAEVVVRHADDDRPQIAAALTQDGGAP
jgi:hypothetical protein